MEPKVTALSGVSNDAKLDIEIQTPYMVECQIEGTASILFHRWSCEAIEEKSKAAKGSATKKTDNIESYLYRGKNGEIAIPSEYFRPGSIQLMLPDCLSEHIQRDDLTFMCSIKK